MVFGDVFDDVGGKQPDFHRHSPETIPGALKVLPSAAPTGGRGLRRAGLEFDVFRYCFPIHEYMRRPCPC